MARPVPRPFTRIDLAIMAASAALGLALAYATDREYMGTHGSTAPARSASPSLLPDWLRDGRHLAIRVNHDASGVLSGLSLGVALATFRPRRGLPRRRRLGPGHVASAVSALAVVAIAAHWWSESAWLPGSGLTPPSAWPGLIPPVKFYRLWMEWRPTITWMVMGAWSAVAVTGGWGRPADAADRLGRWLGWGWIAQIATQGFVYVLAWA